MANDPHQLALFDRDADGGGDAGAEDVDLVGGGHAPEFEHFAGLEDIADQLVGVAVVPLNVTVLVPFAAAVEYQANDSFGFTPLAASASSSTADTESSCAASTSSGDSKAHD